VLSELYEVICPQAGLKDDDGLVAAAALHPFCNTIHADRKRGQATLLSGMMKREKGMKK
jgi:hypothetical protein